ncbi:MAG: hypothetical protein RKP46_10730 [Candidatus Accumulibacter sp.]|uniref:DUF6600 domain-containing protein n=1 Tax=Accumulibacter sp. TaxID=2053492 RepID=UPI002878176D|nr:DUF6600 domain-containing protein [Accumulibacter sp.]MDS4014814.1 hypothetical protein [Accumulibacter sp.]
MTLFRRPLRLWRQSVLLLILSLLAAAAGADPAGRVGRIAWLSGSVHLHRADSGESTAVERNWPVSSGDLLSTAAGARAEVQIGSAVLRLDAGSVLEFAQVDDRAVRLRLLDGHLVARLPFAESAREYELAVRDQRCKVRDAGHYRLDAARGSSAFTVYAGRLQAITLGRPLEIGTGQRLVLADGATAGYRIGAPEDDEFAAWNALRERQASARLQPYVSNEMTGAADLAAYGSWTEHAEYGAIWYPRTVPADWAPYRNGRWIWVAPWGWTWVGDEPWGFAPFHYGRWVFLHGAWGWVPGRRVARPVYAPALVAWVGAPAGEVRGSAPPAIGWFPLAPREAYIPAYRASEGHFRQINHAHVVRLPPLADITRQPQAFTEHTRHAHRALPHAVTTAHSDAFTERRHVGERLPGERERNDILRSPVQVRPPLAAPAPGVDHRRFEGDASWSNRRWPNRPASAIDEARGERRAQPIDPPARPAQQPAGPAPLSGAPPVQSPPPAIAPASPPAAVPRPAEPRQPPTSPGVPPVAGQRAEPAPARGPIPAAPAATPPVRPLAPAPSERQAIDPIRPWPATRDSRETRHERRDDMRAAPLPTQPAPAVAPRPVERPPVDFVRPAAPPRLERPDERSDRHGQERRRVPVERADQWDDSIRRQTH